MSVYSRDEYLASRPTNWGAYTYKRLKAREFEKSLPGGGFKPSSVRVQAALDENLDELGPLDLTDYIHSLNEEEICDLISHFPKCENLIMKDWERLPDKILRSISITMGQNLVEIDLSGSQIGAVQMEILMARVKRLKIIRMKKCVGLDPGCMSVVARCSRKTATELHVDECHLMRVDPFLVMAGCVGFNPPKLSFLNTLSLSQCPVEDKGLIAVGEGCKHLRYLNLNECSSLTDVGICSLVSNCKNLEVINLAHILSVSNKTVLCIAHYCPKLISLNIVRCAKVTDKAIVTLAERCIKLQSANFAGIRKLSEVALCSLAQNCLGLMLLNVTGCEGITSNGMRSLLKGIKYVEPATTFFGFKPVDDHVEKKLTGHLLGMKEDAAFAIQRFKKARETIRSYKAEFKSLRQNKAAEVLQVWTRSFLKRMPYYYMWKNKVKTISAINLQRVWRGGAGRMIREQKQAELQKFLVLYPYALLLQKSFRGHIARRKNQHVATSMRVMYFLREKEAAASIAVRFQCCGRRYLACQRMAAWKELTLRRKLDEFNAMSILQRGGRCYNARKKTYALRCNKARMDDLIFRSATCIQKWFVKVITNFRNRLTDDQKRILYKAKWDATLLMQSSFRGYWCREQLNKKRISQAKLHYAAIQIQRIFRGARTLYWRDLRLNIISAYVLDRQYLERMDSIAAARNTYSLYLEEVKRDSASEKDEDEEEEPEWTKFTDKVRNKDYWYNAATNTMTYDEPPGQLVAEKAMLYKRIRVYWLVQARWYEGVIDDYHRRKGRHRVQYDDGDHEWIKLHQEHERIQIQLDDGNWVMYSMYKPPEVVREIAKFDAKLKEAEFKQEAFKDALQWKLIEDDSSEAVTMFMSEITGAFRSGRGTAKEWIVQDDGFGYPCFYNLHSNETVHEDPRFEDDASDDLAHQRKYVLQELRFALYFVKELWAKYEAAVTIGDKASTNFALRQIRKSDKPKHLAAFLIRAKVAFDAVSVVDAPINSQIKEELDYAEWLTKVIADSLVKAEVQAGIAKEHKSKMIAQFGQTEVKQLFCPNCKRETKKELAFCANCGKRQVF